MLTQKIMKNYVISPKFAVRMLLQTSHGPVSHQRQLFTVSTFPSTPSKQQRLLNEQCGHWPQSFMFPICNLPSAVIAALRRKVNLNTPKRDI
jgi:hypothetical protein